MDGGGFVTATRLSCDASQDGRWLGGHRRCVSLLHRLGAEDPRHHRIEMPAPAGFWPPMPRALREGGSELQHPAPHRLVSDVETALRQQILNVPVAQGEAEIDPYRVLDERGRDPTEGRTAGLGRAGLLTQAGRSRSMAVHYAAKPRQGPDQ